MTAAAPLSRRDALLTELMRWQRARDHDPDLGAFCPSCHNRHAKIAIRIGEAATLACPFCQATDDQIRDAIDALAAAPVPGAPARNQETRP